MLFSSSSALLKVHTIKLLHNARILLLIQTMQEGCRWRGGIFNCCSIHFAIHPPTIQNTFSGKAATAAITSAHHLLFGKLSGKLNIRKLSIDTPETNGICFGYVVLCSTSTDYYYFSKWIPASNNPGCLLFIFLNIEVTYSISESLMSCRNRYAFQLLNGVMFVSSKQEQEFLKIKI